MKGSARFIFDTNVLAGEADWLVTGDRDLLTLGSFHGATILTPAALLDQVG